MGFPVFGLSQGVRQIHHRNDWVSAERIVATGGQWRRILAKGDQWRRICVFNETGS